MSDKSVTSKVTFFDEHLENVHFEYSALRRKLQSKVEALIIMSRELNSCRIERDQYKLMAEQVQYQYTLKKATSESHVGNFSGDLDYDKNIATSVKMLNNLREENKSLTIEMGRLKQRLSDRDGDIRILRQKLLSQKANENIPNTDINSFSNHEREELIKKLETLNEKIKHLKSDLSSVLDEKEELISEKEAYKCKIHRLNHELKVLMSTDKENIKGLDVDALIMENKYLMDRIAQIEAEKELANEVLLKYKSMLEHKKKKGNSKLGLIDTEQVLSQEQVTQLLENVLSTESSISASNITDLKTLIYGIMEALNDKTLALSHQRKTNKILASRIADLEQSASNIQNGTKLKICPSQILLHNYQPSEVDKDELFSQDDLRKIKEMKLSKTNGSDNDDMSEKSLTYQNDTNLKNGIDRNGYKIGESDALPPDLEILVQKAVNDIKSERASQSDSDK